MTVADEQLVDSPPPPPLNGRPSLNPFSWGEDEEETIPAPASSPETAEELPHQPADLSPGEDGSPLEGSGSIEVDGTSSPASSAELPKPTQLLSKGQMRETARAAVRIGGGMAHTVGAKTEEAKNAGLWLTDAEDERNIGHPLADYFHSKGDVINGKLSPEANFALQGLMGFAGYITKQVTKVAEIRENQQGQIQ